MKKELSKREPTGRTDDPASYFGTCVLDDAAMKELLPESAYCSLKQTIDEGVPLDPNITDEVARAMKTFACSQGATHYTHWFQPMSGVTAEKHEAFLTPSGDGKASMEFSGKELVKGEPDASSFPSGGLRNIFEARGYTAWDCTSPAFVKDRSLYIPSIFCSYDGAALDKKTPLLRSMEAIDLQARTLLTLLGENKVKKISASIGAEQEYFLVDRSLYEKRQDLLLCGRTLFGAPTPKSQDVSCHYYGRLRLRVLAFMQDLDRELWKLGIVAKTKHNETAPAQHELAPLYTTANIACDQNNLMMELMRRIAKQHGLVCLLHEKPFMGVPGSGKHVNWSLRTDNGDNLLSPGATPMDNLRFLLILTAVMRAVHNNQGLLRFSVATASNDLRLGAHEAPPGIVSIFLGSELTEILSAIKENRPACLPGGHTIHVGVHSLPPLPRDNTDRNRTSPLAFTGNKFEFRMCGASASVARPAYILNAIVADALMEINARLTQAKDIRSEAKAIIKEYAKAHESIIYNGNNYCREWEDEAARRGLLNIRSTYESIPFQSTEPTVALLERQKVLTAKECRSRTEIMYDAYSNAVCIEARTMIELITRQIIPVVLAHVGALARDAGGLAQISTTNEIYVKKIEYLKAQAEQLEQQTRLLEEVVNNAYAETSSAVRAKQFSGVLSSMQTIRATADALETAMPAAKWPLPSYTDMLFTV